MAEKPHPYAAHAWKLKDHEYSPKAPQSRQADDGSYCQVCGFDQALHDLSKTAKKPKDATKEE